MRRSMLGAALALVVGVAAVSLAATSFAGTSSTTVATKHSAQQIHSTLRYSQSAIQRIAHAPAGDENDVFCDTLTMFNQTEAAFNEPANHRVGSMHFCYTLHGQFNSDGTFAGCTQSGRTCKGSANITTTMSLPGGSLTLVNPNSRIASPFVVKVTKATGRYRNATGNVSISSKNLIFVMTVKLTIP